MANSLKALLKGKTSEQRKVIVYFTSQGRCLSGVNRIKDEEYDRTVLTKLNLFNKREIAMERIGIDEDQVQEIPPVYLHGI